MGVGQFSGSVISRPMNSLVNDPISAIFAYRAAKTQLLGPASTLYTTFRVLYSPLYQAAMQAYLLSTNRGEKLGTNE